MESARMEAAHLFQEWRLNDRGRSVLLGQCLRVVSQFNTMSHYS